MIKRKKNVKSTEESWQNILQCVTEANYLVATEANYFHGMCLRHLRKS